MGTNGNDYHNYIGHSYLLSFAVSVLHFPKNKNGQTFFQPEPSVVEVVIYLPFNIGA